MTAPKPLPLREAAEALLKFLESCAAHPHEAGPSVFCIEADVLRTALAAPQSTLVEKLTKMAGQCRAAAANARRRGDEEGAEIVDCEANAFYIAAKLAEEHGDGLATARALVDSQALDDGLWFQATTAPEAYLQRELRKLHAAIEAASHIPRGPLPEVGR